MGASLKKKLNWQLVRELAEVPPMSFHITPSLRWDFKYLFSTNVLPYHPFLEVRFLIFIFRKCSSIPPIPWGEIFYYLFQPMFFLIIPSLKWDFKYFVSTNVLPYYPFLEVRFLIFYFNQCPSLPPLPWGEILNILFPQMFFHTTHSLRWNF